MKLEAKELQQSIEGYEVGLFDTIVFPEPIPCKKCGRKIESTQTKAFENLMITYQVGDIINSHVLSGLIEESLYCPDCGWIKSQTPVFLILKYHMLIDVAINKEEAWDKLVSFGKKNLERLYWKVFERSKGFQGKYITLKRHLLDYCRALEELEKNSTVSEELLKKSKIEFKGKLNKPLYRPEHFETILKEEPALATARSERKIVVNEIEHSSEGDLFLRHYDLYQEMIWWQRRQYRLKSRIESYVEHLKEKLYGEEKKTGLLAFAGCLGRSAIENCVKETSDPRFVIPCFLKEIEEERPGALLPAWI